MPTREEWLNQGFVLGDHPFEPARVAVHDLTNNVVRVNFSNPLDVFGTKELKNYFEPVGSFQKAVSDISDFLDGLGGSIDRSAPPVLLIEGPKGNGRKTVGNFAAHLMKEHCELTPSLRVLPVTTNHFGRLLFEIKQALEGHFDKHSINIKTLKSRDTFIKPEDPDESVLAGLFNSVAQENLGPPMLILLIGPVQYRNHSNWISKVYGMLKNLNVALLFTTEDKLIRDIFKRSLEAGEFLGCAVLLAPLTYLDGTTLITNRLHHFRTQPTPPGLDPLLPFDSSAIRWMFQEALVIRQVLNFCRLGLNRKLADLVNSKKAVPPPIPCDPQTQINTDDFKRVFSAVMSRTSWGGKP
jgi:hypothetical protein